MSHALSHPYLALIYPLLWVVAVEWSCLPEGKAPRLIRYLMGGETTGGKRREITIFRPPLLN